MIRVWSLFESRCMPPRASFALVMDVSPGEIPPQLSDLCALVHLDLHDNRISGELRLVPGTAARSGGWIRRLWALSGCWADGGFARAGSRER